MHLPRLLPPVLVAVALLAGCTSEGEDAPERFRPPAAGALDTGPCSLVADDLVALGRLSYDLRGTASPGQADRDALLSAQERVAAVAESAPADVRPALDRLVGRTGAVRIQSDTGMLRDTTLASLTEAYDAAVEACASAATTSTSPSTSPSTATSTATTAG